MFLLAVILAIFIASHTVQDELLLQYQCHMNESNQAQENVRLTNEIDSLRVEMAKVKEENLQCMNETDYQLSEMNRSYWTGVAHAVNLMVIVILILSYCFYICAIAITNSNNRQSKYNNRPT